MKVYITTHLYHHTIDSNNHVEDAQSKVDDWAREKGWSIQWHGGYFGTLVPSSHEESAVLGRFLIL